MAQGNPQLTTSPSTKVAPSGSLVALEARFTQIRTTTEKLVAPLSPEDCNLQSMPDASPTKWHLAHTSWFFETFVLERFAADFKPFHPAFRTLFNSYYNAVGDKHPRHQRGLISRPILDTVLSYRRHVTEGILTLLRGPAVRNADFIRLMWLGCNHEEQHQELILTDLKHLLAQSPLKPAYQTRWPLTPIERQQSRWLRHAGGLVEIGHQGNGFSFDNEGPRHQVFLLPYELASHPVTHGEFAAFIAAGGYRRPELWLSMGWDWVQNNAIEAPLYWASHGEGWKTYTLHGMVEIDTNTPICHINYFEADAYARWAGARLPTEAEWEYAAAGLAQSGGIRGNFLEGGALHPLAPREELPADAPAQMFGDVWEWTQSAYLPYPRYRPEAGAVGEYNGKFMCNQFVLRGGSCVTPQRHIRASYRNFFPPDARWQFSGLRLARDLEKTVA
ncbi:MAG TPA: ergothioneine biosynthesis protein EgtB [Usitatibacteraceae bacterium]